LPAVKETPRDAAVPEPGSLWLTCLAAAGLLQQRRLRRRRTR
jgi:hypothetical protein